MKLYIVIIKLFNMLSFVIVLARYIEKWIKNNWLLNEICWKEKNDKNIYKQNIQGINSVNEQISLH